MKKFLKFSMIVGCMIAFVSNDVTAQNVFNFTNCTIDLRIGYNFVQACPFMGYDDTTAGPGVTPMNIPAGTVPVASKGSATGLISPSCIYYIGIPCTGYPNFASVVCGQINCPSYNIVLFGGDIYIFN